MTEMNPNSIIDAKPQNWNNFCQYHMGDWHGNWKRYGLKGEVIDSFRCFRSLDKNINDGEINHQNYYTYADGKTELKNFGPYKEPITKALFLDNSFSWGSTTVEPNLSFGFETGFRYEDRRASAAATLPGRHFCQLSSTDRKWK